jgi:hypothetical protein
MQIIRGGGGARDDPRMPDGPEVASWLESGWSQSEQSDGIHRHGDSAAASRRSNGTIPSQ